MSEGAAEYEKQKIDAYIKTDNMILSLSSWNGTCGRTCWNLGFMKSCHCHKMRPTHETPASIRTQITVALFHEYSRTAAWFKMKTGRTVASITSTIPIPSMCLNGTFVKVRKFLGHKKNSDTMGKNANGPLKHTSQHQTASVVYIATLLDPKCISPVRMGGKQTTKDRSANTREGYHQSND